MFRQLSFLSPQVEPARPLEEKFCFEGRDVVITRKPYRRSLSLTLRLNGDIRVMAPRTAPLSRIKAFVLSHRAWIEGHMLRYEALRSKHPPKRFVEGELFPFFGASVRLELRQAARESTVLAKASITDGALVVEVPRARPGLMPDVAQAIARLYEAEGRRVLANRTAVHSSRMGLQPSALAFRSQKTRWGSCSSRGRVTLNWRLAIAPLEVVDYVIVHELAHLKHHNHSAAFWSLVGSYIPDYREYRAWLRAHQYDADFLAKRSELHAP